MRAVRGTQTKHSTVVLIHTSLQGLWSLGERARGYQCRCHCSFPCSDAAVKQILLQMNSKRPENRQFVIEDLDATHLLIKTDEEESMREELEAEASLFPNFPSSILLMCAIARTEYIQPRLVVQLLRLRPCQKLRHLCLDVGCT
jgi:hypothetical protein